MTIPIFNGLAKVCLLLSLTGAIRAQAPEDATLRRCSRIPDVPTGLSAPSKTGTTVTLKWAAVSTPRRCAVTYRIFQGGASVASGLAGTSYTVTGLTPGTAYVFAVSAADSAGSSRKSAGISVTTPSGTSGCTTAPPVPTGLASPSHTASSVNLAWTPVATPAGCAVSYGIFRNATRVLTVTTPSATLSGLTSGTAYAFYVVSVNSAGTSTKSATLTVSTSTGGTCAAAPSTPTGLASPSQTSTSVNLSWAAVATPGGCSVTYTVYRNGASVLTVPTTTAIISGLTAATSYSFTVAAVDSYGASPQSAALNVTTPPGTAPTPAEVLASVKARMTSANQVNSQPHLNTMQHSQSVNVYQVQPGIFAFSSGMAIDTDGSDSDPDPDHQGQTTWETSDGQSLGAHHVPYYVLGDVCYDGNSPCKWFFYKDRNVKALQFALVFYNGKVIGAVFGDTQGPPGGDARELGEASVQTATLLGIPSSGTTGGVDSGVTYVVFSGAGWVLTGTNSTLSGNAQALVSKALATLASGGAVE